MYVFFLINTLTIYLSLTAIVLLILVISFINILLKNRSVNNVIIALEKNLSNTPESFIIKRFKTKYSDIICESDNSLFYVKILFNPSNSEICVNNKTLWQVRKHKGDNKVAFLKEVSPLMNINLTEKNIQKKQVKKIFLIYRDTRSLLMYINESEMVFVEPRTDVYGATVITYNELLHNETLELTNFYKKY